MNMLLVACGDTALLIDAGVMFPEPELFGVDLVIPDLDGARRLSRPDRGARPDARPRRPHRRRRPRDRPRRRPGLRHRVHAGAGRAEARRARHRRGGPAGAGSAARRPSTVGPFARRVPARHAQHAGLRGAGDSHAGRHDRPHRRLQDRPDAARRRDLRPASIRRTGRPGVLALFSDSTNADRRGLHRLRARRSSTASKRSSAAPPARSSSRRSRRASTGCRLLVDLAEQFERKVAFVGRGMQQNVGNCRAARLPEHPARPADSRHATSATTLPRTSSVCAPARRASRWRRCPASRSTTTSTSSSSADDVVVFSARVIPGNEKAIARVMNHVARRGADIVADGTKHVHVSGHGSEEELKLVLSLVKPRFFVPIHGEYRQLARHARMASAGVPGDDGADGWRTATCCGLTTGTAGWSTGCRRAGCSSTAPGRAKSATRCCATGGTWPATAWSWRSSSINGADRRARADAGTDHARPGGRREARRACCAKRRTCWRGPSRAAPLEERTDPGPAARSGFGWSCSGCFASAPGAGRWFCPSSWKCEERALGCIPLVRVGSVSSPVSRCLRSASSGSSRWSATRRPTRSGSSTTSPRRRPTTSPAASAPSWRRSRSSCWATRPTCVPGMLGFVGWHSFWCTKLEARVHEDGRRGRHRRVASAACSRWRLRSSARRRGPFRAGWRARRMVRRRASSAYLNRTGAAILLLTLLALSVILSTQFSFGRALQRGGRAALRAQREPDRARGGMARERRRAKAARSRSSTSTCKKAGRERAPEIATKAAGAAATLKAARAKPLPETSTKTTDAKPPRREPSKPPAIRRACRRRP